MDHDDYDGLDEDHDEWGEDLDDDVHDYGEDLDVQANEQDVLDGAWEDLDEVVVEVEQWVQVWLEKLVE